jgi:murein DD-endopeptidase MepM/ murein hydrolase activator NlpD
VYQLPYAPGNEFKVTQGYNGSFSHKGSNKYAIDWKMPEGTPVRAARGGVVVKIRDASDKGGSSLKYDKFNNYVLIRHDDGTLGHYCHLQKKSSVVKVGQTVKTGEMIARSGNTGFSSGPHLHFCVFKTRNGRERESIPVRFKTSDKEALTLMDGHRYKAADTQSASAQTLTPQAQALGPLIQ